MAKRFFVDAKRVGIVLENDTANLKEPAGVEDLNHSSYAGGLYDPTDQTYAVFEAATQASIDNYGKVFETFQQLPDNYDHDIELREDGSGSVKIYLIDDDTTGDTTVVDSYNLLYMSKNFPIGVTNTGAGNAEYNPADDLTNSGVKASDLRGYAIVVEMKAQDASVYQTITFHNAKIEFTLDQLQSKKGAMGTLKWTDARNIDIASSGSEFGNHSDS